MKAKEYDARVIVRMPMKYAELVNDTARMLMTTQSDYIRRAVVAQLQKDGIEFPK
jgi:hypothetical protein